MAIIFNPDTGEFEDDEAQASSGSLQPGDPGYRLSPWAPGYDPGPNWNNGIAPNPTDVWNMETNAWGPLASAMGATKEATAVDSLTGTGGGDGGGGGGTGAGGGDWGYLTEPFTGTAPTWQAGPTYTAPTWEPPPPFSYKQFQAPTPDSIYADPSYQFREGQGRQALQQSAGAKGVLRTGGTLKDLINYGQNAASQEYSNIYGRAVDAHNMGLEQELGTYGVNYGVGKDERDYLFDASKAEFAPQQRENEQMNQRQFDSFLANYDIFERNRRRAGDYLTWAADQGGK